MTSVGRVLGWDRSWALALLCVAGGLAGCVVPPPSTSISGQASTPTATLPQPSGRRIAILAPISGPNAEVGRSILRAARLALQAGGGSAFDERDTKGTPDGAAVAARSALEAGAGIMVGPLTAAETGAVAAVAQPRNVPVLAFTSDATQARPGVWTLGITPGQQVRAVVRNAASTGRRRVGGLLPRNAFGDALASALQDASRAAGLTAPVIVRYRADPALEGSLAQLGASGGVDALLLGGSAEAAVALLPSLTQAGLGPDRVLLMGTALWAHGAPAAPMLAGSIYAAPDPQTLRVFEGNYMARYGTPPREVASVGFDAAGAARAATGPGGINASVLLGPAGFEGPNGTFVLLPDGHVRRTLTVFTIEAGGVRPLGAVPEPLGAPAM